MSSNTSRSLSFGGLPIRCGRSLRTSRLISMEAGGYDIVVFRRGRSGASGRDLGDGRRDSWKFRRSVYSFADDKIIWKYISGLWKIRVVVSRKSTNEVIDDQALEGKENAAFVS